MESGRPGTNNPLRTLHLHIGIPKSLLLKLDTPSGKIAGVRLSGWGFGKREKTIELASDISGRILNAYSTSNQTLAAKSGVNLDEHGYFDFN